MSEPVSALAGAHFEGAVTIEETGLRGLITMRGDLASTELRAAVKSVTGLTVPKARQIKSNAEGAVAWMSPDELLLIVDHAKAERTTVSLSKALKGQHHLAVNVSDARAVFVLRGRGVREVLAKGAPVDLSPGAFKKGEIRRTRIGQIAAAFWLIDQETAELVCFRSVAGFMFDWLRTAAQKNSLPEFF